MSRLFGTDGIRGVANEAPLTTELVGRLARQLVATLRDHHGASRMRLVVGRDTRLSGHLLEGALVSGALSAGADVYAVGVMPTPGIAYLTRRLEAHGGVVLSASHNAFEDNGIKIFSAEGAKLPDAWEEDIERRLEGADHAPRPIGTQIGSLFTYEAGETDYITHVRHGFSLDLTGLTVALDCANGATHRIAPKVFRQLGARVVTLGARPDGRNINRGSGALHPEALQRKVVASGAHVGLAFDGDGDRLIAVDERGLVRDGDYILAVLGRHAAGQGRLKMGVVVTTVMANLGLDRSLAGAGVRVVKTRVGDRYVLEEMLRIGANLGGEQSGHLLFLDHSSTGDGIVSALHLLSVMRETRQSLSDLASCMTKFPQILVNVPVKEKRRFETIPGLERRVADLETALDGSGRIVLRYSGTESLARVMVEGEDQAHVERTAAEIADMIRAAIGQ
jgi:phosphoglucosamine mutase